MKCGVWTAVFVAFLGVCLCSTASAEVGKHPLPDSRAYEQVSPVDKNEADVRFNNGADAAADGSSLVFTSDGSFAGQPTAQFQTSYLSRRSAGGWSTKGIQMPNGRAFIQNGYVGFSEDLSKGVIRWMEDTPAGTFAPGAVPGLNMYLGDEGSGFQLLNGTLSEAGAVKFAWGSADFDKIGFESNKKLTADAPCPPSPTCAYEWDHGTLRLASVLEDGTPVGGVIGGGQGGGGVEGNIDNAVSRDGSRVFFISGGNVYAREEGTHTTLITGSERTLPGGVTNAPAYFQGAEAAHGDRVIFTTKSTLVDADQDETNDLYMYDFAKAEGARLSLLSKDANPEAPEGAAVDPGNFPGNVPNSGGVLARGNGLDRVYFVADNQILPGEPEGAGPKLYVWDGTGAEPQVRYIATLSPEDANTWDGPSVREVITIKPARISPNGRYIAFTSLAALNGEDENTQEDAYRYDAATQELSCLTCVPDAFPAKGLIRFDQTRVGTNLVNHLPRNVSDSGQVFFQTARGLVPSDPNGKVDVYEYENGELFLLSGGSGGEDSYFLDASASGDDVFFDTRDQLVGWDKDVYYDAYDAKVGGGLSEPPPPPPPCEGDSCQPPPVIPNDPTPASLSFNGPGNVRDSAAARCGKGKVRRKGRCEKKKHQAAKQHKSAGAHKSGGSRRG
jgi:hypothetical protein